MGKQKTGWRWVSMMLLFMLVGCGASVEPQPAATKPAATSVAPQVAATRPAATPTAAAIATLAAEKSKDHDEPSDYVWNASQVVQIALQGNTIAASGAGVKVNGAIATIVAPGTYSISGALNDGQIIVNTTGKGVVRLVLNGADIHSSTGSPIYVMSADKTVLVLADNTRNSVSDAKSYVLAANETEPNAAIFSKGDLTIFGNGSLSVAGNFNDGIASKDGLIITSGTITVNAVDDGIRGKDYLIVKGGNVTVTAQGDGLKADNAQDPTRGYISIADGVLKVTSGRDAIQAQSDVMIAKGKFVLTAGGGSNGRIDANTSAKGIKGVTTVTIGGGTFTIDSADDAVHS
ncbi:MAG: carbohydrate-binding domain-containing protein, partial [Chloroflexi bacterium]|nr:carbohydrate-binding domain-containing protein [Chloroflexota bacterium]